jgi:hypothetical protein
VGRHNDRHADRDVTTTVIGGGAVQRRLLLRVRQRNDAKLVPDTLRKIHNTEMSLNRQNVRTWKTTWTAELPDAAKGETTRGEGSEEGRRGRKGWLRGGETGGEGALEHELQEKKGG